MTTVNYNQKKWRRSAQACIYAVLVTLLCCHQTSASEADSIQVSIASVKTIHSKVLNEDRKLYIRTPARMLAGETYPVLYLLDGGEQIELVGGEVAYLSESYKIIPQLIIVGIDNTDRVRDLTPTHSLMGADGRVDSSANAFGKNSGGGENFLRFMKEELMPYIEAHYPTAPYRILSGHSLGGLLGVYAMVHHPDYFNACIAISPSLQWDNGALVKEIAQVKDWKRLANRTLFFSDGNEAASFHRNQIILDSLLKGLHAANFQYSYVAYPTETHTAEPVKAFYDGIRTIYPDWFMPFSNAAFKKTMRAAMVKDHYSKLSAKYAYTVMPPQDEINAIARFLRNDTARIGDAIELLQMNAVNYPTAAGIYELLGDTYMKANDKPHAIASYKKALDLKPGDMGLQDKLKNVSQQ
jgi:predicted alpha/beta superfamily hydrolase